MSQYKENETIELEISQSLKVILSKTKQIKVGFTQEERGKPSNNGLN